MYRNAWVRAAAMAAYFSAAVLWASVAAPAAPPASAPATRPAADPNAIFARGNIAAWCIVPYDGLKRTPQARADMLARIGIRHFAYDWRGEHLPTFPAELDALAARGVHLDGVWFPDALNADARFMLKTLSDKKVKTQLWVMTGAGSSGEPEQRVAATVDRLKPVAAAAAEVGCTLGLYNHGGWAAEPRNMVAIVERLKAQGVANVGIVYNFSHGHGDFDKAPEKFAELFKLMLPHLLAVNLNGSSPLKPGQGDVILPFGQGSLDLALLKTVRDSGYAGPVGVINESDEDAEARLLDNLDGLAWLVPQLDGKPAGPKPQWRSWRDPAKPRAAAVGPPSVSPAFGRALAGEMLVDGKPEYRSPPITIECRAMLKSKAGFNVLVASDTKASAAHWELYTFAGNGKLSFYLPGYEPAQVQGEADVCDGKWHRFSAQFEPTRVRLYVDGKQAADVAVRPKGGKAMPDGLAFGGIVEGGIGCDGLIDDVRLSRGARDIPASADVPLTKDDQTLGLWSFDEVPGKPAAAGPPIDPVNHWAVEDAAAREKLPPYQMIPAAAPADRTPTDGTTNRPANPADWDRSHGGDGSGRFSPLAQITPANAKSLKVAWTYRSGDGKGNLQCNPVVVDGVMYAPTVGGNVVAVDAATGVEKWRFKPGGRPAHRGLTYHRGKPGEPPRLMFVAGTNLWCLDPATGKPIASFGDDGRAPIVASTTAPAVYQDVIVIAGFGKDVFGYDLATGKQRWTFRTIPKGDDPYAETWDKPSSDGANAWGGLTLDAARGIAYVTTGSPKPNFVGVNHLGDNLYGNCVVALDVLTGVRLWHFQEIRHDIWDLDGAAPPVLLTVTLDGKRVDAVAAVTKIGNTLLLDRVTGKPLFPFRLRRAPTSILPGERTAAYQPAVELPEPFARQQFSLADVTNVSPAARESVLEKLETATFGWFRPFEEGKPLAMFGFHGGADWPGACVDPATGTLFVASNELPWLPAVYRNERPPVDETKQSPTAGRAVYALNCMPCHGPSREGVGVAPSLLGVSHRLKDADVLALLKTGRGNMPAAPQLTDANKADLLAYLFDRDRPNVEPTVRPERPAYRDGGYPKLLDAEGYPGCKPPWGLLTAIDLNTGKTCWRVPLGEHPELTARGVPKTGTENFGGPSVTAGGVVFCGGTRDIKFRAFDAATGEELWSHPLPFNGTAPPTVYAAGGKQYVVIPATGGGKLQTPEGDAYVAFSLP